MKPEPYQYFIVGDWELTGKITRRRVKGIRIKGSEFAAHAHNGWDWQIDHAPSGRKAIYVRDRKHAVQVLKEIAKMKLPKFNLDPKPNVKMPAKLKKQLQPLIVLAQRVRKEIWE